MEDTDRWCRFIAQGCMTVVLAIAIFFLLPDSPMEAWFLSNTEKVNLLHHVKINQTGIEHRHFMPSQLKEAAQDWQIWAFFVFIVCLTSGTGVVNAYSATLIKGYGDTARQAALLNMGSGPVAIVSCFFVGFGSRLYGNRWLFLFTNQAVGVLGAGILAWIPHANEAGTLTGIYLVTCFFGSGIAMFQWLPANVADHTKISVVAVALNLGFSLGNIIGAQTFQAKDAPRYQPAKIALVALESSVLLFATVARLLLGKENKRRDATCSGNDDGMADSKAYAGLTDKENINFRYVW